MTDWSFRWSSIRTAGKLGCWLAAAVWSIACAGQPPSGIDSDFIAVRRALDDGLYGRAERQAQTLEIRLRSSSHSLRYAQALDLLAESLARNGKSGESGTLALAERSLGLKEALRASQPELADSFQLLGFIRGDRGEFTLAITHDEMALKSRRQDRGLQHPSVADSLDHLAFALIRLERFAEARRALEDSQRIREQVQDRSLEQARTLELVALLNRYEGAYARAVEVLDRSLELQRRLAPGHPALASALQLKGDLLWLQGDIEAGRRSWGDALSLVQQVLGPEHPDAAPLLRKLALAADAVGELAQGRRLRARGLQIGEASLGPCHPERANLLNDQAMSLKNDGEYPEAHKKYELAIAQSTKCFGEGHSLVITATHNQADLAAMMGDFTEAERLHEATIAAWSSSLGPDHPYVARALDSLAEVRAKRGQYGSAQTLYLRALEIRRQAGGRFHPDVAWTLTNLATAVAASGDVQRAGAYAAEAVNIYKSKGAADTPDYLARALELRGILERRLGRLDSAKADILEALELRRQAFGATHPITAGSVIQLARVQYAAGDRKGALASALAAEQSAREHLRFTVRYLADRQAMAYAASRPRGLDLALSITAAHPDSELSAPVFDSVIRSRGIVLDEMVARAQLIASPGAAATASVQRLHAARERFANLVLISTQPAQIVPPALFDRARREKEQAERDAADYSGSAQSGHESVGLEEVRRSLPVGAALVSFIRYSVAPPDVGARDSPRIPSDGYLAFVTRSESDRVSVHALGRADSMDRLVTTWRSHVTSLGSEDQVRLDGRRLFERTWNRIANELNGVSLVFVVPDGALNLVNFAALPAPDGRYLIEDGPVIHYLSTERDLVGPRVTPTTRSLLALGGPTFGDAVKAAVSAWPDDIRGSCAGAGMLRFKPLAGTVQEVSEVGQLWSSLRRTPATVLTGDAATEEAFRRAASGREVIHLATHGFFLGSTCRPIAGTRAVGGLSTTTTALAPSIAENPLALSGLALAGANRLSAGAGNSDGILTAEEVAGLNLQNTEWAVLSACDTGVGEIMTGEGVLGLRRAFQIAGARTVIMSLWSVEDRSAAVWMRTLYEGRLQRHLNTADAVHQANITVLRGRRANGQSTHPFYWAGFVAAGAWH